jgi:hypothetical protein
MHIRTMEESKEDSVHFLKAYLINDLRVHIFEILKKKCLFLLTSFVVTC